MPLYVTESNEDVTFLKRSIAVKNKPCKSQNMIDFFCEWVKMYTTSGELLKTTRVKHTESSFQTQ